MGKSENDLFILFFLIIAASGRKVGWSIQLNELMKLKECQISRFLIFFSSPEPKAPGELIV